MKSYVRVSEILARLQDFANIDESVLSAKAAIGTSVHNAIQQDVNNEIIDPLCERAEAYFYSYREWRSRQPVKYLMMESRLFDDELMITGQMDAVIDSEYGPMLIDYKTSAKANEKIWNMQAHFYWYLLDVNGFKIGNKMRWINLRHKKTYKIDEDGNRILDDFTNLPIIKYEPLPAKVYEFTFDQNVLDECISEAIKYWDEKADNFCID